MTWRAYAHSPVIAVITKITLNVTVYLSHCHAIQGRRKQYKGEGANGERGSEPITGGRATGSRGRAPVEGPGGQSPPPVRGAKPPLKMKAF